VAAPLQSQLPLPRGRGGPVSLNSWGVWSETASIAFAMASGVARPRSRNSIGACMVVMSPIASAKSITSYATSA
jgi:hypothetical protein